MLRLPSPRREAALEPRRTLTRHVEAALECQTRLRDRSFIKKAANECHAMRHAARR
jgi:hypothetical protein